MQQSAQGQKSGLFEGLDERDLDACQKVLAELGGEIGFNAEAVFAQMRKGVPLIEALGLPHKTADALYAHAYAQFNAGEVQLAMPLFQALTFLEPGVRDYWLGFGICARSLEDSTLAQMAFLTAASLTPNTAAPAFHLCELYCHTTDWPKAQSALASYDAAGPTPEKLRLDPEIKRLRTLIRLRMT